MYASRLKLIAQGYLPPTLWAGLIFLLSSQRVLPGIDVSGLDFLFKKTAHMFVYGVLFLLVQRGILLNSATKLKDEHTDHYRFWLVPMAITLIYAVADEIHQTFVPGRYGTFRDIGFDMVGVLVAFLKRYQYI